MVQDKEIQVINFTKFVDADKKTAKVYDLVNGELIKSVGGNFWNGSFETINIPYTELPDFIKSMEAGEFIVQGIHQNLHFGNCPTDAARKKDLFPFSNEAGLLIIDTDAMNMFAGISTLDDLVAALVKIEPALKSVMKFCSSSASSYVEYKGFNSGLRGVHTYLPICSALDNKTIIEALHIRSVNAGFAYPKVTKAGTIKINSLVDTALKTSNQPVFEGGAILNDAAITQAPVFKLYEGGILDVSKIHPLTDAERSKYAESVERLRATVLDEANVIKATSVIKRGSVIRVKSPQTSKKNSEFIAGKAINDNLLYGQFIIRLETGEEVTIQSILDNPKKYHLAVCSHPLDEEIADKTIIYSDQARPIIHTFAHGEEVFYLHPEIAAWEINLINHVEFFNQTHTQVIFGGKHKIMRTVDASIHTDNPVTYEYINIEELKKIYSNTSIQVGEKKKGKEFEPVFKDKITAWATHPQCCVYTGGVVFKPSEILPENYYNLWQGFAIMPKSGASTALIKQHIEDIICNRNPDLIKYFYDWVAFTMQRPEVPVGAALVLRGEKGCGKGILGHFLRKIWGNHGMHISNPDHLVGNFNNHLANLCFLFADEAFYSGDKSHEGMLKALITEPTMMIEPKGVDSFSQPNFLKIFMATNSDFAVPASKDERRYGVFDVSSDRINDDEYFCALGDACKDKAVQSAFLYEMLNRDISDFHANNIPETQGLKDQRLHSLPAHGQWLADSLTQGYFNLRFQCEYSTLGSSWQTEVATNALYASYTEWCNVNKKNQYDMVTVTVFGKYLKGIFVGKKLKGDLRGYVFGDLDAAILTFQNHEKVDLGIERESKTEPFTDWFNDYNADEVGSASVLDATHTMSH